MSITFSKESTLRAVRTLYQGFVALAVVTPVLVALAPAGTPLAAAAAVMVAAVAVVSKVLSALEEAGIYLVPKALRMAQPLPGEGAPAQADPPAPATASDFPDADVPEVPTSDAPQADPAP